MLIRGCAFVVRSQTAVSGGLSSRVGRVVLSDRGEPKVRSDRARLDAAHALTLRGLHQPLELGIRANARPEVRCSRPRPLLRSPASPPWPSADTCLPRHQLRPSTPTPPVGDARTTLPDPTRSTCLGCEDWPAQPIHQAANPNRRLRLIARSDIRPPPRPAGCGGGRVVHRSGDRGRSHYSSAWWASESVSR